MKVAVIGSGPAGASAAYALVEKGADVTVYDVGYELEDNLKSLTRPGHTPEESLAKIRQRRADHDGASSELPEKLCFGSRFVYKTVPGGAIQLDSKSKVLTSFALGGLSNVWGANVGTVADRDMVHWPFKSDRLKNAFRTLENFVDVSTENDAVDELYSVRIHGKPQYPLGPQGLNVLTQSNKKAPALKLKGIHVGRAKIACGTRYSYESQGCVSCGMCMHGCSYNAIFNAANVIKELISAKKISYKPHSLALSYSEKSQGVEVQFKNIDTHQNFTETYDKVFIGAGVLGTTALVARSMGWSGHEFTIRDSQKYYFPFITFKRTRGASVAPQNTLAQIFIQLATLKRTHQLVHFQLYPFNEIVLESLRHTFGVLADLGFKLLKPIFDRLMIGMVYLHSEDSGSLGLKINADQTQQLASLTGRPSRRSKKVAGEAFRTLIRNAWKLGGIPLPFFKKTGPSGRSQHFGGTLPMKTKPGLYETDEFGRPYGTKNVHVVDTSVLTSVPGTPTTYIVMANSVRIVQESV